LLRPGHTSEIRKERDHVLGGNFRDHFQAAIKSWPGCGGNPPLYWRFLQTTVGTSTRLDFSFSCHHSKVRPCLNDPDIGLIFEWWTGARFLDLGSLFHIQVHEENDLDV
jgi:hypothetical protein